MSLRFLALLNEAGDQAVRSGTATHSGELVFSTEAANWAMADFHELFGEGGSIEVIPWLSTTRTQMSPPRRAVAVGELHEGVPPSRSARGTWTVSCFTYSASTCGLKAQGSAPQAVVSIIPFLLSGQLTNRYSVRKSELRTVNVASRIISESPF